MAQEGGSTPSVAKTMASDTPYPRWGYSNRGVQTAKEAVEPAQRSQSNEKGKKRRSSEKRGEG